MADETTPSEETPEADGPADDADGAAHSAPTEQAPADGASSGSAARRTGDEASGVDQGVGSPSAAIEATHQELLARMRGAGLGDDAIVETGDAHGGLVVRVANAQWRHAGEIAKEHLECDYLSFISGIDWQPAPREGDEAGGDTSSPVQPTEMTFGVAGSAGRFQVFAHVQSTSRKWGVTLKADVDDAEPQIESWVSVYDGADWHERECWEMYGFVFDGHPNLRHLYLPFEFEGHPLRKDFPLLARIVKPWPGLVDVEPMPGEPEGSESPEGSAGASSGSAARRPEDGASGVDQQGGSPAESSEPVRAE